MNPEGGVDGPLSSGPHSSGYISPLDTPLVCRRAPIPTRTRSRATPLAPPRMGLHLQAPAETRVEVRARRSFSSSSTSTSTSISELGDEEEEENGLEEGEEGEGGTGVSGVRGDETATPAPAAPPPSTAEERSSTRERNRRRHLRRRRRRREQWRHGQLLSPPAKQASSGEDDREGHICAVCLDVYFSPYMCHPCKHVFCEPCLRTLAKGSPTNTPCPLCRTVITHVLFHKDLNQSARTFFPKEYLSRKQSFQKASCAKWPLPSCRKLFRIFGGLQRPSSPIARHQFPHGGGYRLNAIDSDDDSRGWRFDMDMAIIYIYSINWVIGFFIFCFLCYLFFSSLL